LLCHSCKTGYQSQFQRIETIAAKSTLFTFRTRLKKEPLKSGTSRC
jgi:hypothetical protein